MDELLLSRVRLSIVSELLTASWVSFPDLLDSVGATNGNLNTHLAKLVAANYVKEEKTFMGRRPSTRYRLTARGRKAFFDQVEELQNVARSASRTEH